MHYGRDFSSYQGNLTAQDCAGIEFAYVKITEGDEYKNPYAPQQVAMLRQCGVAVGFYHFLDMGIVIGDQLHNFATMAAALGGSTLPPALDSETPDPSGWNDLARMMIDFLMGVESWTTPVPNPRSLVYVNGTFYANLPDFPWGRWVWFADPSAQAGQPSRTCLIQQMAPAPAPSGKVIDFDIFIGSEDDWAAFLADGRQAPSEPGPSLPVPPALLPEEEDEPMVIYRRIDNGAEYADILGEVVHIDPDTSASLVAAGAKTVELTATIANTAKLTF